MKFILRFCLVLFCFQNSDLPKKGRMIPDLSYIATWKKKALKNLNISEPKTLIYPFGGADIVFPLCFFDFDKIVIIGLEVPGGRYIEHPHIDENLNFFLDYGYFVTKTMQKVRDIGILSLLIKQLFLLQASDIKFFIISSSHIKITFSIAGQNKTIEYHKLNLHNYNYNKWIEILRNYRDFSLFLKSASYAPRQIGFEKIKNYLLNRASFIIQDDTGLPYNELLEYGFKIKIYGKYYKENNLPGLLGYLQPNLVKHYSDSNPEPLLFSIGYYDENLMIAYK